MNDRVIHSVILWSFLSIVPLFPVFSQPVIEFVSAEPQYITPCGPVVSFSLSVSNSGDAPLPASTLSLQLPDGLFYEPGTVTGSSESDISNLNQPEFSLNMLAPGATVLVSVDASIYCSVLSVPGTLSNTWEISGPAGTFSYATPPYNMNLPVLTVTNFQNFDYQGQVGDSFIRSFDLTNTGFGPVRFLILTDVFPGSISITGASPGTFQLLGNTATLELSASEFMTVGNGDEFLDQGETITIFEMVQILDCAPGNSTPTISWGCNGEVCETIMLDASVTVLTQLPDLQWSFIDQTYAGFCAEGSVTVEIQNTGSGSGGTANAFNLILEPGMGAPGNSILPGREGCLRLTGFMIGNQSLIADTVGFSGYGLDLSQLTVDPDGPGGLTDLDNDGAFDDLPGGESVILTVGVQPDPLCFAVDCPGAIPGAAFKLRHYLENQCQQATEGQLVNDSHLYQLSGGIISDNLEVYYGFGEQVDVVLQLSRDITGFECNNGQGEIEIVLPQVMELLPGSEVFVNGTAVPFNLSGNTITFGSTGEDPMVQLSVSTLCDSTFQEMTDFPCAIISTTPSVHQIQVTFSYFCDLDCSDPVELFCGSSQSFVVRCEDDLPAPTEGVSASAFQLERKSLGWTDSDLSTRVDPLTPGLALHRVSVFDTLQLDVSANVFGPGDYTDSRFFLFYFNDTPDAYFDHLAAEMMFFDQETGMTIVCTFPVGPTVVEQDGAHSLGYDLLPLFQPGGCAQGLAITEGDSIRITATVVMQDALPTSVSAVAGLNAGFVFNYNGEYISCNEVPGLLEVIDPEYSVGVEIHSTATACDTLRFEAQLLQGKPALGPQDPFPFEVRPYARYDSVYFELPPGHDYLPGSSELIFEYRPDQSAAGPLDTIQVPLPDPVILSLPGGEIGLLYSQYDSFPVVDVVRGQTLNNLSFRTFPICMPEEPVTLQADLAFTRYFYSEANRTATNRMVETTEDYQAGSQSFAVFDQIFFGQTDTAFWELEICHTSEGTNNPLNLPNNFLYVDLPAGGVNLVAITDVTDPQNPVSLPFGAFNGGEDILGELGTLAPDSCRLYELAAIYTTCEEVVLPLTYDYRCSGYPADSLELAADCNGISLVDTLRIIPQDAGLQINLVDAPVGPVDLCTDLTYELQVINTQPGRAFQPEVFIEIPAGTGLFVVPGSCSWENGSGGFVALPDPQPVPGTDLFVWSLAQFSSVLASQGLGGVGQSLPSELRIRFDLETNCSFVNLSVWSYFTEWENACGSTGETIPFFAPAVQVNGIPLTLNTYAIDFSGPPLQICGDPESYAVTITSEGPDPTSSSEIIRVQVDGSLQYDPGSFTNLFNIPGGGEPVIYVQNGFRILEWNLPDGLPMGDSLQFSFGLFLDSTSSLGCISTPIQLSVLDLAFLPCATAPGGACELEFAQSDSGFDLALDAAVFELSVLGAGSIPLDPGFEEYTITYSVANVGTLPGSGNLLISFYLDTNGSGIYEPGTDLFVDQTNFNADGLSAGSSDSSSQTFSVAGMNTCAGILLVLETMDNPCICSGSETWLPALPLANAGSADTLCFGGTLEVGSASIGGYSYQWQPDIYLSNPTASSTDYSYTGPVLPGSVVTDTLILETTRAAGCVTFDTVVLTINLPGADIEVLADYNGFGLSCPGANDGSVAAVASSSFLPYSWTWDQGLGTDSLQSNLAEGTYQVTLTDGVGCIAVDSVTLIAPPALTNDFLVSDYNGFAISCAGAEDGNVTSVPGGGVGSYSWQWEQGPATNSWENLTAGIYQVEIIDANGCSLLDTIMLSEPPPLQLELTSSPILCIDGNNGSITLTASGGVGPYQFAGNTFDPEWIISDLDFSGNYDLLIMDSNGCEAEDAVFVDQLVSEFDLQAEPVICPSGNEGTLCVIPGAGYPPYTYAWSDGTSESCLDSLFAGAYAVTVFDSNGCAYSLMDTLADPSPFSVEFAVDSVSCFGNADGTVSASATGGTAPYEYTWTGGLTGPAVTGLPAGNYNLTLTDSNGCTFVSQATIGSPEEIQIVLQPESVTCHAGTDGQIMALVNGGVQPYNYAWNNGQASDLIDGLEAGMYTLSVVDATGCQAQSTVEVTEPAFPEADLLPLDISCYGYEDGQLAVADPVGSGYSYSLNGLDFQIDPVFSNLAPGGYTLSIQTPLGCVYDYEAYLSEPAENLFEVSEDQTIDLGESADLFTIPLTQLVSYAWNPAGSLDCGDCPAVSASPLETTTYEVMVETANGCVESETVTVRVLILVDVYIPNIFSPDFDGTNDAFLIFGGPSVARVEYLRIFDRWGGLVFEATDIPPNQPELGWDGFVRGQPANQGVYVYVAEVVYIDGRRELFKGDVTLVR